ncbi:unnamed protein product [Eruca vesicaria subsp. sativa]|uniref:TVP38/TMEM64 family membrane protein n=1 Tax=Eruca vesicaria subsp. sativa TaxID=29727 RepID=A0ABC8KV88_ERUVS|nr:unnamed protein product [Eruca vesicaria subsp. sativa]
MGTSSISRRLPRLLLSWSSVVNFVVFMIPWTIFMSLLAGALFGVVKGGILVVFNAIAGATCCFFLSKLIGQPLITWLWPDKLRFFQVEAGLAIGDLKSVKDLYDFKTFPVLFLIGFISILPTILKRRKIYE